MSKPSVEDMLGARKELGKVNRLTGYLHARSDIEFSIAEEVANLENPDINFPISAGPDVAAVAGKCVSDIFAAAPAEQDDHEEYYNHTAPRENPGRYLVDMHGTAQAAADHYGTGHSDRGVFSTRVPESNFLNFLGTELGVGKAIGKLASKGVRIVLKFGEAEKTGGTEIKFQTTEQPPRTIAHVEVHDDHPFINLRAEDPFGVVASEVSPKFASVAPFEGEADIAGVSGAADALMVDMQVVATRMIEEFSDASPGASAP